MEKSEGGLKNGVGGLRKTFLFVSNSRGIETMSLFAPWVISRSAHAR